jgi:hypothetical protein
MGSPVIHHLLLIVWLNKRKAYMLDVLCILPFFPIPCQNQSIIMEIAQILQEAL